MALRNKYQKPESRTLSRLPDLWALLDFKKTVLIQSVPKVNLVKVGGDVFLAQLVRVRAEERHFQSSKQGNQRLKDAVGFVAE
jgi:hypothetical protein